jgi:hypothetical protein
MSMFGSIAKEGAYGLTIKKTEAAREEMLMECESKDEFIAVMDKLIKEFKGKLESAKAGW